MLAGGMARACGAACSGGLLPPPKIDWNKDWAAARSAVPIETHARDPAMSRPHVAESRITPYPRR